MFAVKQTIGVSLTSESKTLQLRMNNFDELRLKVRNCFGSEYSQFLIPGDSDKKFTKQVQCWDDVEAVARALPQGQNVQIRVEKPSLEALKRPVMHHARSDDPKALQGSLVDEENQLKKLTSKSLSVEEFKVKAFFDDLEEEEILHNYSTDLDPQYYHLISKGQIPCGICKGHQDILCNLCMGLDRIELSSDFKQLRDYIFESTEKLFQKVAAKTSKQTQILNKTVPAFQIPIVSESAMNDTRKLEHAPIPEAKQIRQLPMNTAAVVHKLVHAIDNAKNMEENPWEVKEPPRKVSSFEEELNLSEDEIVSRHAEAAFRKLENRQKNSKYTGRKTSVNKKCGTSPKGNTVLTRQKTSEVVQQRKESQQTKVQSSLRKKTEDFIHVDPANELQRINFSLVEPEPDFLSVPKLQINKTVDDMNSLSKTNSMPRQESVCTRNICESCGCQNLIGNIYRCDLCEEFELCEGCYMDKNKSHDPSHTFTQAISELSQSIRAGSLMGSRVYGSNRRNSKFVYTYDIFKIDNLRVTGDNMDIMLQITNTSGEPFPDDVVFKCREEHLQSGDCRIGQLGKDASKIVTVSLVVNELKFVKRHVTVDFEVVSLGSSHKHFENFKIKIGHPEYNKEIYYIEDVSVDPNRHKRLIAEAKMKCETSKPFMQLLKGN